MARPLRIEYPGATYHVMARGNQGRPIFEDDLDRRRFLETLGEACAKSGWRIHAWVLMGNHYHLLVETPEANLVAGMQWLQGTYTQRYNRRHAVTGHLFQGRYQAVPVEASNAGYLEAVSSYIHLNPARAGLIQIGREKLKSYLWSSFGAYARAGRSGPAWLERARVLGALRLRPDDGRGYEAYLEGRVLEIGLQRGRAELEEQWKELRRGWYVGGDRFAERMRRHIERALEGRRKESHSGAAKAGHSEGAAGRLLEEGLAALALSPGDLARRPKVTAEKAALAAWLRERTTVSLRWLAARMELGHYTNAGRGPRRWNAAQRRRYDEALVKHQALATKEISG